MKITLHETDNPYQKVIRDAIELAFPVPEEISKDQAIDAVLAEIISSSKIRFGPAPILESRYLMHQVVSKCIENDQPINIMVPYGSMKPDGSSYPDVADIMAIKMLKCLDHRVKKYWTPGIRVKMRVEDIGGYWLFRELGQDQEKTNDLYVSNFLKLVRMLCPFVVESMLESDLLDRSDYFEDCERTRPHILKYLEALDDSDDQTYIDCMLSTIEGLGWKGVIPSEQRVFYYGRYMKMYGDADLDSCRRRLADYFAGALARYRLGGVGYENTFEKNEFIQLNFASPVPGVPRDLANRIINYRTIHGKYTRDHLPPWRALGYLRIYNDNETRPAVVGARHSLDMKDCFATLRGEHEDALVNIRYVLMD